MTDSQTKQLTTLTDTCNWYNATNRAASGDTCFYYDHTTQRRCAVGRLLTIEQAKYLEPNLDYVADIADAFSRFPNEMEKSIYNTLMTYGVDFLEDLQGLHDDPRHWNETGLTALGIEFAEHIKTNILDNKYLTIK